VGGRSSPACWTWPAGRRGCGSSSARNARTRAGPAGTSPISASTASAHSRRAAGSSLAERPSSPASTRAAKDTGLRNIPLHGYAANQIGAELVAMACEFLAWMQMLALPSPARRWEPKRLRLRIFTVAGRITPRRPAATASPHRTLALGHPDHRRLHPPPRPWLRLTSTHHSRRPGKETARARGTPPTWRDSRAIKHGQPLKRPSASTSGHQIKITKERG